MLLITCPWCGHRDEIEFRCGGQSHITRPEPFDEVTDQQWGAYLFFRTNAKGSHHERWVHEAGCKQWFNVVRDTVTHKIYATYKLTDLKPVIVEEQRA